MTDHEWTVESSDADRCAIAAMGIGPKARTRAACDVLFTVNADKIISIANTRGCSCGRIRVVTPPAQYRSV
jgi:hypothetical protein